MPPPPPPNGGDEEMGEAQEGEGEAHPQGGVGVHRWMHAMRC